MKKLSVSIPEPCHENWSSMAPTDHGRYCLSCQKEVIDFSVMTDREIAVYLTKVKGGTCGNFLPEQLDRSILIPKESSYSWKYFFRIVLPAFLFVQKAKAQNPLHLMGKPAISKCTTNEMPQIFIGGMVVRRSERQPGYTTKEIKVNSLKDSSVVKPAATEKLRGEVLVASIGGRAGGLSYCTSRTVIEKAKDKISGKNKIKIYPNPLAKNSIINIDMKGVARGEFLLQIVNASGSIMQQEKIQVPDTKFIFQLALKNTIASGTYFLRVIDPGKKLVQNARFVVL